MSDFSFEVTSPFGVEMLKLFASTNPLGEDEGDVVGPGFQVLSGDLRSIVTKARGIAVRQKEAMYAEDTAVITTVQRKGRVAEIPK